MIVFVGEGGWYLTGTGEVRNANNLNTPIGGWFLTGSGVVSEE